jgi:glucose-1-phosphate adenylyltransferase
MGNYLFNADVLLQELQRAETPADVDFGRHLLPRLVASRRVWAYDFTRNRVPGVETGEEPGYWRDVGTLDAYFAAHLDTLGGRPRFSLHNPHWPIHCAAGAGDDGAGYAVAPDCAIGAARVDRAWLRPGVAVEDGAQIEQSIVMDRCVVGRGASLVRTIVDEGNHIPDGESIGGDFERARGRFPVSDSGIAVVPRGHFPLRA